MWGSSSDSDGPVKQTPPRKRLQAQPSSPIHERKALRKNRRHKINYAVLEGNIPIEPNEPIASGSPSAGDTLGDQPGGSEAQSGVRRKAQKVAAELHPEAAFAEALAHLAPGFAEDLFLGHGHAKLNRSLAANATLAAPDATAIAEGQIPQAEQFLSWMQQVRIGFSVLVQGVGSKKQLLRDFADQALKPAGLRCVHMHAFDARFSLLECLRGLLEQVFPNAARQGTSADALAATVRTAVATPGSRPLCFVVHSLENLPRHHLVALASLAASPGIHLVASVDSIWASLAWDCRCLKDFNFCFKEVHTFAGYEVEATARHPRGLPPWSGLGKDKRRTPKASLSLVMRSLTNNHRELVQAMAEEQLETEHNTGISIPALLKVSTDRLIALTVPKLKSLLNELIDHEIVVQRGCSSAVTSQAIFCLPFDEHTLEQLRDGKALDSDEEGAEAAPCDDGDEDIMA